MNLHICLKIGYKWRFSRLKFIFLLHFLLFFESENANRMEISGRCLSSNETNPCISYCDKQLFNQTDQWYACALLNYEILGNEMTFPEVEHALKLVTKFTNVHIWMTPLLLGFMVGAIIGVSLVFLHCFCTKKLVHDRLCRFKLLPKKEFRQQQKQNQQHPALSQFEKRGSAEIVRSPKIQSIGKR